MRASFPESLRRVLVHEGGYSNHPQDRGGVTGQGIIQRVYDAYREEKGKPKRAITRELLKTQEWAEERDEIYRQQYWVPSRCDELPKGVDYVVFDGSVNSGVSQSAKWLQRCLGVVADGQIGVATVEAAKNHPDHDELVAEICARRMAFLQQLKNWSTFGEGWTKRVTSVKKTGQAWATGKLPPMTKPIPDEGSAKADTRDVSEAPVGNGTTATVTTGGIVVGGVLDKLQETITTLTPLGEGLNIIKYAVLALSLVSAGLLLYGVWRSYKAQRARNGEDTVPVPTGAV